MNAPITTAALTPEAFKILALVELAPSTTRTQERRRARFTKHEISELAANIKQVGIMLPIIARPHPKPPNAVVKYEIVAGERRWLAAREAGLVEAPVIVRQIADADLVQFQLTENLQRKTIDQLEEAEGYDELRKLKKITADQVADLLGVSRSTVFNRLKLLDLCPEAVRAVESQALTPSNAMLIARLGHHDTQRQVLKQALEGGYEEVRNDKGHHVHVKAPLGYRELRSIIEEDYMVDLKGAPFKLEDAQLLPKAGSCAACPKRTGNQKDLVGEFKNPNVCTDPKCFDEKRQVGLRKSAEELRAKGRKVIAGADAKKVIPDWEEDGYGKDRVSGGFTAMDEKVYSIDAGYGKTPKQLLGKDYQPIIVQHPGSGKLIEVASQQAIAAAAKGGKSRNDDEDLPRSMKAKKSAPKVNLPDLDHQVTERLIQIIAEKAPKKFNRGILVSIAKIVLPQINSRHDKLEMVAKQLGWSKDAFGRYGNGADFPKAAAAFDEAKIMLLFLYAVFAAGWGPHGHEDVLEFLYIDADKTRETIIAERRAAQAAARLKAKLAKASPLIKTGAKGKLKWPFPTSGKAPSAAKKKGKKK